MWQLLSHSAFWIQWQKRTARRVSSNHVDVSPGRFNFHRRVPVEGRRRRTANSRLARNNTGQLHRRVRRRGRTVGQRDRNRRGVPHLNVHDAPAHPEERGDLHLRANSRAHHHPGRQSDQIWETDQENKEVWHYNDPGWACGDGPAKWGERWGRWLDALWCQIQMNRTRTSAFGNFCFFSFSFDNSCDFCAAKSCSAVDFMCSLCTTLLRCESKHYSMFPINVFIYAFSLQLPSFSLSLSLFFFKESVPAWKLWAASMKIQVNHIILF